MSDISNWLIRYRTPIFIILLGFMLTVTLSALELKEVKQQREQVAANIAQKYASSLQSSLDERLFTLDALNAFVHSYASLNLDVPAEEKQFSDHFARFADELHLSVDGILSLQLAPQGVISYVTGSKNNQKARGYDLFEDDARREQIVRAIYEYRQVITGPISLIQGGEAIIARKAIFAARSPNASADRLKEKLIINDKGQVPTDFWGLASVLFTPDVLLKKAGLDDIAQDGFEFAIRGRHGLGAWGEVFWGNESVFDRPSALETIEFKAGSWVLGVKHLTPFPYFQAIVFALLGTFLTAFAVSGEILLSRNRAARESDSAKDAFLASMSHEIRSPLNGVVGLTSLLRKTSLEPEQVKLVDGIESSADQLSAVIGDILDFSKIAAGKVEIETQPVDLQKAVSECIDIVRPNAMMKSQNLSVSISHQLEQRLIETDKTRLKQILLNLLSNAVKFTDNEGQIDIAIERVRETEGDYLNIKVADTGIGLTETEINRLFKRFSQGDMSTTRKYGGTGLGLAISRNLARLMGGDLIVESEKNHGSKFTLSLPLRLTDAPPEHHDIPEQNNADRNLKILVVDDLPMNQNMLVMMLNKIGYAAEVAENGLEAVNKFKLSHYDLIFMDWEMPVMDGIEATKLIRAHQQDENGPWIVALTANASTSHKTACKEAGMDDYVAKPVGIDDISRKISQMRFSRA